jgi:hypothetical protein
MMRMWHMSWRPQGFGHIGHVRLRVQHDMKWYKVLTLNTRQCKVIAEGMAYALQAQKKHLMMAWQVPCAIQACI